MSAAGSSGETLVVRRVIPVPRERVFQAWLDPASLAKWMRPSPMTDATADVDARVGGKFRIVMLEGPKRYEHTGEYRVIKPPERLEFTWISDATDHRPTVVTIEFLEREPGTEVVLTHRRLPATQVESHRRGWTDILQHFERRSGTA
ncbi:MAG TPA: SRPBCC domain-containing protein [Gemmatimonadales bacterium]